MRHTIHAIMVIYRLLYKETSFPQAIIYQSAFNYFIKFFRKKYIYNIRCLNDENLFIHVTKQMKGYTKRTIKFYFT